MQNISPGKGRTDKPRQLLFNLLVLGFSLALIAGLTEGLLRVFGSPGFERYHQKLFVQYEPLLGWSKIPNKQATHVTSEYTVIEYLNSRGIRGPEYTYTKGADEFRIVMLGDSFTEGYSVQCDQVCSQVLQRKLGGRGFYPEYTVINAGTGGYSTDQEYIYFDSEMRKYHPDITILMFYANDVLDNDRMQHWRGQKPGFEMNGGKLQLVNVPVPKPAPKKPTDNSTEESTSQGIKSWLYENSRLYQIARQAVINNYNLHLAAIRLGLAEPTGTSEQPISVPDDLKVWAKEYDDSTRQAWELTEALLVSLDKAVASAGSKFLVFYVPISAAIYDDEWEATKKKYGLSEEDWSIRQVGWQLGAVCARNGIDFIDPTDHFLARAKQDKRLYYPLDRHWTAEGHRLAAEILAAYIGRHYISSRATAETSEP